MATTRKAQIEAAAKHVTLQEYRLKGAVKNADGLRAEVETYPQTHPQRILKARYAGGQDALAINLDVSLGAMWELLDAMGIGDEVRIARDESFRHSAII